MPVPFDPWQSWAVAADVAIASRASGAAIAERTTRRLNSLLEWTVGHSPRYRHLLDRGVAPALADMPIVRKGELMRSFDSWCCDPAVRLQPLRRFVADRDNIGRAFLDRYTVWESSGSSGEPALFVEDSGAMAVYDALEALRKPELRPMDRAFDPFGLGTRIVFVGAIGGHFASTVSIERMRRLNPILSLSISSVSFLQPLERVLAQLDARRPTVIATYPSAAVLLAGEFRAGRLGLAPKEIWTGGETLTPAIRSFVQETFGCRIVNSYGASEFLSLACECANGALHLNSDWAILEPVDGGGRAAAPGTAGTTTLLTNLANRVQPLIRYDLGDRVTVHEAPCECGSHLPVIDVVGRCDDTLRLGSGNARSRYCRWRSAPYSRKRPACSTFSWSRSAGASCHSAPPRQGRERPRHCSAAAPRWAPSCTNKAPAPSASTAAAERRHAWAARASSSA